MLDSADDVVGVVSHDDRLADCTVRRVEPGWMELEISGLSPRVRAGQVLLVLVWPAVWRDPASLAPHLVRARSGNYGLLLVGTDAELSAGHADKPCAPAGTPGPIST